LVIAIIGLQLTIQESPVGHVCASDDHEEHCWQERCKNEEIPGKSAFVLKHPKVVQMLGEKENWHEDSKVAPSANPEANIVITGQ
jgi:hypothetical protein